MSIQIITNSPNINTPKTYWKIRPIELIDVLFDGINDYLDAGSNAILAQGETPNSEVSYSFWFKISSNPAASAAIMAKNVTYSILPHVTTAGIFSCDFKYQDATSGFPSSGVVVTDGIWHHGVVEHSDVTDQSKLYLDGVLKATVSKNTFLRSTTGGANPKLCIGAIFTGASSTGLFFGGNIKDVRIYDKALTDEQVLAIYEKTGNNDAVPVYWLPMNEGSSNPKDRFNDLTTTLNGAVWNLPAFQDAKLADVISNFTQLKYVQSDPFNDQVIFGLEPTQSASAFQIVIQEGSTDYEQIDVAQYFGKTDVMFDIYAKNAALAENFIQLENMLIGIQEVWMNYNPHQINGLSEMIMQNKDVEKDTSEQSRSSTYYKTIAFTAIYQIARTTAVETNTYIYSNPDIAGEIGS